MCEKQAEERLARPEKKLDQVFLDALRHRGESRAVGRFVGGKHLLEILDDLLVFFPHIGLGAAPANHLGVLQLAVGALRHRGRVSDHRAGLVRAFLDRQVVDGSLARREALPRRDRDLGLFVGLPDLPARPSRHDDDLIDGRPHGETSAGRSRRFGLFAHKDQSPREATVGLDLGGSSHPGAAARQQKKNRPAERGAKKLVFHTLIIADTIVGVKRFSGASDTC